MRTWKIIKQLHHIILSVSSLTIVLFASLHCMDIRVSPQIGDLQLTSLIGHFRSTLTFTYKEGDIEVEVPFTNDGEAYINATEVYKKFGKSKSTFAMWKKDKLTPYAELLIEKGKFSSSEILNLIDKPINSGDAKVTIDDVIITVHGGDVKVDHEQGTWFHPKLAIFFARWLSPEFETEKQVRKNRTGPILPAFPTELSSL